MSSNISPRLIIASSLLCLLVAPAEALDVTLDSATAITDTGEYELRVDGRARFKFDPKASTLTSAGTWTGQYTFGPNKLPRFTHKVEDFSASMDGRMAMRSYECVEGTVGGVLALNHCGNYRFGPNGQDDGGMADDVMVGPRKSLASFSISALTWDGEALLVILSANPVEKTVFQEYSLELRFSAAKPAAASRQPAAR